MDMNVGLVILGFLALVVLILVVKTLYTVRTYTAGVVERFGKFARIVQPGLHTLVPFAERVFFVDLQVKQAQFSVETKTGTMSSSRSLSVCSTRSSRTKSTTHFIN